ncbi:uncharacterized protein LOC142974824 isoform X2 [Anticarsia gemmatalis]
MSMPGELSMPVQRVLRTMVSGIMLVQCFTVYVYLASYIVLLYPVFLEERPTLVLPWLLLAAVRKLLCELTSLALGLGTCVLLGPAKAPCVKFLVVKISTILPAFYMWMLVYSYYHALKVVTAFKTFPVVLPPNGRDYGLELAVRRRCTKSLFGEEQLRKKLIANFYSERASCVSDTQRPKLESVLLKKESPASSNEDVQMDRDVLRPLSTASNRFTDIGAYEDWFGSEIMVPRGTDRILEQFVVMLLRIGAYLQKDGIESINSQMFSTVEAATWAPRENIEAMSTDVTDTPPLIASSKGHTASYLREYPQIFMKKLSSDAPLLDCNVNQVINKETTTVLSHISTPSSKSNKSNEMVSLAVESIKTVNILNEKNSHNSVNESSVKPKLKEKHNAVFDDKVSSQLVHEIIQHQETLSPHSTTSEDLVKEIKPKSKSFEQFSERLVLPKQIEKRRNSADRMVLKLDTISSTDEAPNSGLQSKGDKKKAVLNQKPVKEIIKKEKEQLDSLSNNSTSTIILREFSGEAQESKMLEIEQKVLPTTSSPSTSRQHNTNSTAKSSSANTSKKVKKD